MNNNLKNTWVIAGNDSGGGAGLAADMRTLVALGIHICPIVAAVTAQNSINVTHIAPVNANVLQAQLNALKTDMPPNSIKIGMLGSLDNLRVVVKWLQTFNAQRQTPVVIDPVLKASTGANFVDVEMLNAYALELLPLASVITPNTQEAGLLVGVLTLVNSKTENKTEKNIANINKFTEHNTEYLIQVLQKNYPQTAIVVTGGDVNIKQNQPSASILANGFSCDAVSTPHAQGWLKIPRVSTTNNHGTGCCFASSVAGMMAHGFVAMEAIVWAKMATTHALRHTKTTQHQLGVGWVMPQFEFAQQTENLPTFHPFFDQASAPDNGMDGGEIDADLTFSRMPFTQTSNQSIGLYFVASSADWVLKAFQWGIKTVQLRIKNRHDMLSLRTQIQQAVKHAKAHANQGAQIFINDEWELAIQAGAHGVHLGQEDALTQPHALQAIAKAGLLLGISTHCLWEVCRAMVWQPSYIACGPIHATTSKDMPWLPQGNLNVAYWSRLLPIPIVAIGGMDAERANQAMHAGASGVALIGAIEHATDPEKATTVLLQAIQNGKALRDTAPVAVPLWAKVTAV